LSAPIFTSCSLDDLLGELTGQTLPQLSVSGVNLDSRLVEAGDLYLAVDGAVTHGMRYAESAIEAGAVAVATAPESLQEFESVIDSLREKKIPIVFIENIAQKVAPIADRFYQQPDQAMTLIAVTGTDGKTSVCRFIAQAFVGAEQTCGYIGTLGWGIGEVLQSTELTTPDAVSLRRMLASLRSQGANLVALEASSHGLAEGRLDGLALDVAVLTNLGRDHLDYHKTIEAYREAKAALFAWPSLTAIVVNALDEFGAEILRRSLSVQRFAFQVAKNDEPDRSSIHTGVDAGVAIVDAGQLLKSASDSNIQNIRADDVLSSDTGLQFNLQEGEERSFIQSSLLGRFNVENLLACYGSLRACGVAANEACHYLSFVRPVEGRMERFGGHGEPTVVVDFSHTPQALSLAIESARVHCQGKLWVVFGCGGDRDPGKRAPMAAASESADRIVLTDDNPRTESSAHIISETMQGFTEPNDVHVISDRADAIRFAVSNAVAGDLVLVAGKGHENYQIIGTTRYPFSDRAEVLAALEEAS